jgi:hypothetical protein
MMATKKKKASKKKSRAKRKPKAKAKRIPLAPIKGAKFSLQKAIGAVPAGRYCVTKVSGRFVSFRPVKHLSRFETYTVKV